MSLNSVSQASDRAPRREKIALTVVFQCFRGETTRVSVSSTMQMCEFLPKLIRLSRGQGNNIPLPRGCAFDVQVQGYSGSGATSGILEGGERPVGDCLANGETLVVRVFDRHWREWVLGNVHGMLIWGEMPSDDFYWGMNELVDRFGSLGTNTGLA